MLLSKPLLSGLHTLYDLLEPHSAKWLLGGSCGLLLHGVSLERSPRDVDIYIDQDAVDSVHNALREFATDAPAYSETPIYASILSHYQIEEQAIEVVGAFRVHALSSSYRIEAGYLWERHSLAAETDGRIVKVMPLAHELLFNLLRSRPDRYERIAQTMRDKQQEHLPALHDLLARNSWSEAVVRQLEDLLGCRLQANLE